MFEKAKSTTLDSTNNATPKKAKKWILLIQFGHQAA